MKVRYLLGARTGVPDTRGRRVEAIQVERSTPWSPDLAVGIAAPLPHRRLPGRRGILRGLGLRRCGLRQQRLGGFDQEGRVVALGGAFQEGGGEGGKVLRGGRIVRSGAQFRAQS